MSTFVRYDPVFRDLLGTESGADPEALRKVLKDTGVTFIEVSALPAPMETIFVGQDGDFYYREELPEESRPADMHSAVAMSVPEIPLPDGGVTEPPAGTPLNSGETYVRVRAPGYLDHYFIIRVWTADDVKRELIAFAANRRWELETAGAPFRTHRVATDDRSKILMMGSVMAAQLIPGWSTNWQFLDGGEMRLNGADVAEMSLMTQTYVNKLFDIFGEVKNKINAGEVTTKEQVLEIMVPPQGS